MSGIDAALIDLIYILIGVVIVSTALAIWLIRRIVANPLARIAEDLSKIERFDVERIPRRPSKLSELANLSAATASMAAGLSAFRKYVPTDLVKMLVAEGIKTQPGGDMKQISVLFCDVTGFTGLSEKLGPKIIQLMEPFSLRPQQPSRAMTGRSTSSWVTRSWRSGGTSQGCATCRKCLPRGTGSCRDRGRCGHQRRGRKFPACQDRVEQR